MLSMEMVEELPIVEEELIAEVTERMRQNLAKPIVSDVAFLEMSSERLYVVKPLFPNEHSAPFQTDLAECLLVLSL